MFPNIRLMIAAVAASVVALSCGFAMFAAFRVNHEPLSRLATGAAPLQLTAGNPIPTAAMPAAAESFGVRFPVNQAAIGGAPAAAAPPEPDHDGGAPSTVASTAATAPETDSAELDQPAPEPPAVAQAAATEPKQDKAAVTPNEPLPATSDTAAAAPLPAEQPPPAEQAAPTEQASQETKPETKPATTAAAEPSPAESQHKTAHRRRVAAKPPRARQARAFQPGSQPSGIGGPFIPPTNR
jgi:hypothetical protein